MAVLSTEVLAKLQKEQSTEARRDTAASVAELYAGQTLSPSERKIALSIIEALTRDIEREVRATLSSSLARCATVPRDVARSLAEDEDIVALPMLRLSQVLSEEDLISIVRSGSSEKRQAIAGRPTVSNSVSEALVETGDSAAVNALLGNKGASISEASLHKALDAVVLSDSALQLMADRPNLPKSVVEKLVKTVTGSLRSTLVVRYSLDPGLVGTIANAGEEQVLKSVAERIELTARATPTNLLRALYGADLGFFEQAMSVLAKVSLNEARRHLQQGAAGLDSLYQKANLPQSLLAAFKIGLDEAKAVAGKSRDPGLAKRITDRIVGEYGTIRPGSPEKILMQLERKAI